MEKYALPGNKIQNELVSNFLDFVSKFYRLNVTFIERRELGQPDRTFPVSSGPKLAKVTFNTFIESYVYFVYVFVYLLVQMTEDVYYLI